MLKQSARMGAPLKLPSGDNPVAKFRHDLGLSQSATGKALGISSSAVAMYERGDRKIPKTILILIALLRDTRHS